MKRMISLLALVGLISTAFGAVVLECPEGSITIEAGHQTPVATHTMDFVGVEYDEAAGTSTWYYQVASGERPAISHLNFALHCPDILILDAGIWTGDFPDVQHLSKAGKPEPSNFPAAPSGDPTTGIYGLKFDLGFNDDQTRKYYFTVNDLYAAGPITVAVKAGPREGYGILCGPSSTCDTVEPTNPAIQLTKWADPQTYSSVGETITYLFTVKNTGNVELSNLTIEDGQLGVSGLVVDPATLAPGQSGTASATYTITAADLEVDHIDNTATVTGEDETGTVVTDDDSERIEREVVLLRIRPILECVVANGDGTYTAHFGYLNENDAKVTVDLGVNNQFVGGNAQSDPITGFEPGRSDFWPDSAMQVVFDGGNLVWHLQGRTATASAGSARCTYYLFFEKVWLDKDGELLAEPPADLPEGYTLLATSDKGTATGTYDEQGKWQMVYQNHNGGSNGLQVAPGGQYTVEELDLPVGWFDQAGTGLYMIGDGYATANYDGVAKQYLHVVENREIEGNPAIKLTKTADPQTYHSVGQEIEYSFTVKNIGDVELHSITIDDPLITVQGGPLTSLEVGESDSTTFSGVYTIAETDIKARQVVNVATVHGQDVHGQQVSADDHETITWKPQPQLGSIGDFVWLDANGDGIQDPDEPGVAGVTVRLLSETGEELRVTTTDSEGFYLFTKLVDGVYEIEFVRPGGYVFTVPHAGADPEQDSDADPVTGLTGPITLAPGQHRRDIDAGLIASEASIELIKDGVFQPGTLDPWDECDVFGLAGLFNAFIFGDLDVNGGGGDTEGRLVVGGTASFAGGYSVAEGGIGVGHPMPVYHGASVDSLIVGGDLFDGQWGVNGNIVYGGERFGEKRYMINGNIMRKQSPVTFNAVGNVPYDGSGLSYDDIYDRLLVRSIELADFTEQGVIRQDRTPEGQLHLEGADENLNVFVVEVGDWNISSQAIYLTAPEESTVLINVVGEEAVTLQNGAMFLEGVTREQVLVHYVASTNITIQSFDHEGSVLALHADLELGGGSINGRAVIGGDVETHTGGEFHNFFFLGTICLDGQEPPAPPSIAYTFTVTNTGNVDLENVQVTDPLVPVEGGPIQLAAGESEQFTATLILTDADLATGAITNTAKVVSQTATGQTVTDNDTHIEEFEGPEVGGPPIYTGDSADRPDFVMLSVQLTPSPTLAGTWFEVSALVRNEGEVVGVPHSVAAWVNLEDWNNHPSVDPDAVITDTEPLAPGASRSYDLGLHRAPFEAEGTFHVIARVNPDEATSEWSYGNNFSGATYSLEPVTVEVQRNEAGFFEVTWNSVAGHYYFVERTVSLNGSFTSVADNLAATPPVNTFVDPAVLAGPAFYRVWGYKP